MLVRFGLVLYCFHMTCLTSMLLLSGVAMNPFFLTQAKEEREQEEQRESLRQKLAGSRRLKSAVIMKKSPSSTVDDGPNDQDASEDRLPPDKDQKEKTKEGSHDDDDDDVKVIEKEEKEDKDITVIEVSSEDEEEPSPKMKK